MLLWRRRRRAAVLLLKQRQMQRDERKEITKKEKEGERKRGSTRVRWPSGGLAGRGGGRRVAGVAAGLVKAAEARRWWLQAKDYGVAARAEEAGSKVRKGAGELRTRR